MRMKKDRTNSGWSATTQLLGTALWRVGKILDTSGLTAEAVKEARIVLQDVSAAREEVARNEQPDTAAHHSHVIVKLTPNEQRVLHELIETVLPTVTRQQYRHLADVLQKLNKPQP